MFCFNFSSCSRSDFTTILSAFASRIFFTAFSIFLLTSFNNKDASSFACFIISFLSFSREDIFFEYKVVNPESLEFSISYLFNFSFKSFDFSSNEKRIFSYILTGRRGYPGLIKKMDIKQLGRGVLRVPIQFSEEIQELLEKNNIKYKKETTIFSNFV